MKFLYFGDTHYRPTSPENRVDNFSETMKRKTEEIISIGKKHKVSAFLQPGDFFDKADPPNEFVSETANLWGGGKAHEVFTKYNAGEMDEASVIEALKSYIPMIGVVGNHELFGNNISTLKKTAIGQLNKWGLMKFATKENPYYFKTEDGLKVAITGTHYHLDIDSPEHVDDYVVEEKLGDIHIHIVHGYLTDKSKGDMFRHTLIDQIKHTKADLTISGHDHIGFPITEVDGKYFVNPGAIPRQSNDLKEINRQVKVLLIDITKEYGLKLKEIPLKSAVDGNLVLNRTKIVERKKKASRLEEFKKAVREAGVKKATDITEIVRDIADNRNLPVEVKNQVVERVSEKMSIMKKDNLTVSDDAYVTKIILENFQSHEYTELDFSKGFNIFVGESKQGKTAVLRAFDWVYENKPSGKRIIRIGSDYARVTVHLSNGYVISRLTEAKRGGKNGYEITDPDTGEVEYHNTKILPEVQKILGFNPLYIDKDLQFNLNFLKQGTGWFLIGDQFSAPQKAKIIGGIYGTQYADAVIRDIDSENKRGNEKIKQANEILAQTEIRLKEYDYLPELETSIQFVEKTLKEIQLLKDKKEKLTGLLQKRQKLESEIVENNKSLEAVDELDKAYVLMADLKREEMKRNQLETLLLKRSSAMTKLELLHESLDAVKDLDEVKRMLRTLNELINKRETLDKVVRKHTLVSGQLEEELLIINETEEIPRALRVVESLKKGFDKRTAIETLLVKHLKMMGGLSEEEELINQTSDVGQAKDLLRIIQEEIVRKRDLELKLKRVNEVEKKRVETKKSLDELELSLKATSALEDVKELFNQTIRQLERKNILAIALNNRTKANVAKEQEEQAIQGLDKKILKDVAIYQSVLEKAGKCPVCFGTIDKATINRIVHEYIQNDNEKELIKL